MKFERNMKNNLVMSGEMLIFANCKNKQLSIKNLKQKRLYYEENYYADGNGLCRDNGRGWWSDDQH